MKALDVDVAARQDLALPHVGRALDGGHLVLLLALWGMDKMCISVWISVCVCVCTKVLDGGHLVLLVGLWGTGSMCIGVRVDKLV